MPSQMPLRETGFQKTVSECASCLLVSQRETSGFHEASQVSAAQVRVRLRAWLVLLLKLALMARDRVDHLAATAPAHLQQGHWHYLSVNAVDL